MDNIINFPDRSRLREEASLWLAKLDGGELSNSDSQAFREWLNKSVDHKNTITELAGLWENMDVLSELSDLFPLPKKPRPGISSFKFSLKHVAFASVSAMLIVSLFLYVSQ